MRVKNLKLTLKKTPKNPIICITWQIADKQQNYKSHNILKLKPSELNRFQTRVYRFKLFFY